MLPQYNKFNVFGFDKGTGDLKTASFASDITSGSEANQLLINASATANEAVYRDLQMGDMIWKLDILKKKGDIEKEQKDIMKRVANQEKDVFRKAFVENLNRGFTQKDAKRMALQTANKFRDEEISYWFKKIAL